jgi:3-hydroxyisobutyrate dehydrogenase-like beta-hydroxyacid dehydrogenase
MSDPVSTPCCVEGQGSAAAQPQARADRTTAPAVGFIGLGVMEAPMARNVARAGFRIPVYDLTPDFPLRMGCKDIDLALHLAASVGAPLGLGAYARELFALAKSWGRAEQEIARPCCCCSRTSRA